MSSATVIQQILQSAQNDLQKYWIFILAIIIFIVAVSFILFSFKLTRVPVAITLSAVFILITISVTALLFLWPQQSLPQSQYALTLWNIDPTLSSVTVTLPPTNTIPSPQKVYLAAQAEITGYTVPPTSTVKAIAISNVSNKITYKLNYTFSDITSPNLYFTCGGPQNDHTYISSLAVYNGTGKTTTLYTFDLLGNFIPYKTVIAGNSFLPVYLNQSLYIDKQATIGVTIPSIYLTELIISASAITLRGIPSVDTAFENGTKDKGYLAYMNKWNTHSEWVQTNVLQPNQKSKSTTIYVGQWWQIQSKEGKSLSETYVIQSSDINNPQLIILT